MLIVDGYNVIYASDELGALARTDLAAARECFQRQLVEYGARKGCMIKVVFDAASREGPAITEVVSEYVEVTYTAQGQTADSFIESMAYELAGENTGSIAVATGDYHLQKLAAGVGMLRITPREMIEDIGETRKETSELSGAPPGSWKVRLIQRLPEDVVNRLMRLKGGKR